MIDDSRTDEQIARDIRNSLTELQTDCAILIGRGWTVSPNVREYSVYTNGFMLKSIEDWSFAISKTQVEVL